MGIWGCFLVLVKETRLRGVFGINLFEELCSNILFIIRIFKSSSTDKYWARPNTNVIQLRMRSE